MTIQLQSLYKIIDEFARLYDHEPRSMTFNFSTYFIKLKLIKIFVVNKMYYSGHLKVLMEIFCFKGVQGKGGGNLKFESWAPYLKFLDLPLLTVTVERDRQKQGVAFSFPSPYTHTLQTTFINGHYNILLSVFKLKGLVQKWCKWLLMKLSTLTIDYPFLYLITLGEFSNSYKITFLH